MGMRTVLDPLGGNDPLVNQLIGSAYDVVRHVAANLPQVQHVSANLELIHGVSRVMDAIQLVHSNLGDLIEIQDISTELVALHAELGTLLDVHANLPAILEASNHAASAAQDAATVQGLVDSVPNFTISELPPSGGNDGDVWFKID